MKKFVVLFLALLAVMLLLVGCDSVADEEKIQEDLQTYTPSDLLGEGEQITAFEIEKRQTEKENQIDVVWCNLTTEDAERRYEKSAVLTYTLYDEGGWLLDYVEVNDESEWVISPLVGVSDEDIKASLNGVSVTVDNSNWNITGENAKGISIDEHTTDLEQKTDTVTVSLTIEDMVEEATGELTLSYIFDNEWELDSVSGDSTFTVSAIEEKALQVSENDLLNALLDYECEYGASDEAIVFRDNTQIIKINESEFSDFTAEAPISSDRGTIQEYTCHGTLTKPNAVFSVEATIPYYYISESGWVQQPVLVTLDCISADIAGEWTGSYRRFSGGTAVLNISAPDEQGKISGVYSYTPSEITDWNAPGSYEVSGTFDPQTMLLKLQAGEWIVEPERASLGEKQDVNARLTIDESILEGTAQDDASITLSR